MSAIQQLLSSIGISAPKQVLFDGYITNGVETTWIVPTGETSVCAVLIGAGQGSNSGSGTSGGGGGDLVYANNIPVTSGESLTIRAGKAEGFAGTTQGSYIKRGATTLVSAKGGSTSDTTSSIGAGTGAIGAGGNGSTASAGKGGGGGGAGGYGGSGGDAGTTAPAGSGTSGGGGGGTRARSTEEFGGYGGGVCPYGQGTSGVGADGVDTIDGGTGSPATDSQSYGGGAGGSSSSFPSISSGDSGCVRIIWGSGRSFPSTRTMDE